MSMWSTASGDYGMTSAEADPPLEGAVHWLTRFDPNDGEPYGELCHCEAGEDHDGNGDPFP